MPTGLQPVPINAQAVEPQALTGTAESHWPTHWWKAVLNHPERVDILTAWPTLPEAVMAGILAMMLSTNTMRTAEPGP